MFIRVVPYDPFWEVEYENESQKIKNILKDILVEVYHIGSTAVKGLAAKSIIDIMPVVTNISLVDKHNKEFVAIGYECMGEFGSKHSKKCTFYTLRFGCSFAAVNTIKPQLL